MVKSFKDCAGWQEQMEVSNDYEISHNIKFAIYSNYEHDLDEIAIHGCAWLCHDGWNNKTYKIQVNNPTWGEILDHADMAIEFVDDHHHVFLEGIYKDKKNINGTPVYWLSMGS